jgi:RND superfamily putative drug exporter
MTRSGPTVRIARWSATHPWRAIGLWVVFVVTCVALGSVVGTKEQEDDLSTRTESGRASQIIDDGNFVDPAFETILVTARQGRLDAAAAERVAAEAGDRVRAVPGVVSVEEPVRSADGNAVAVRVQLRDRSAADDNVDALLRETAAVQAAHPELRVEQAGGASIGKALNKTLGDDFRKAELFSIPLTLVILLVAFGALIAAAVPLLLALSAVAAAIGLSALTSHLLPANDSLSSIILLIGLAVGVDYSLFYVRREREERAAGRSHTSAIEVAAATSGHAIVVSGIAVIVSMSGLYLAREATFASIATGSILVVAVAVVGSITVLPGLLAKLGRWIDRPRVPFVWRLTAQRNRPAWLWPTLLRPVLRRPALTFGVSVLLLGALAAPALGMKLKLDTDGDLPRSIPEMQTYDRLTAAFPSTGSAHVVAVKAAPERAGTYARRSSAWPTAPRAAPCSPRTARRRSVRRRTGG